MTLSTSAHFNPDQRLVGLTDWLYSIFGANISSILPASEDASFRRYFRVKVEEQSFIVMDAPPNKEDIEPFIRIARCFRKCGLNVPEIIEVNKEKGYILLTDFGSTTYFQVLSEDTVDTLYEDAIDSLVMLQSATKNNPKFLPDYTADLFRSEMELFRTWYLGVHFAEFQRASDDKVLNDAFEYLVDQALEQPRVWVHLDYHSRNLMQTSDFNPGIIDFQDARYGPITYDLVSLLRDCYVQWPQERIDCWVEQYRNKARQFDLPTGSEAEFVRWFDLMGVQRHLKATGIFARLKHRDNKPGFMKDIPRVLSYMCTVSRRYEPLQPLHELFARFLDMAH